MTNAASKNGTISPARSLVSRRTRSSWSRLTVGTSVPGRAPGFDWPEPSATGSTLPPASGPIIGPRRSEVKAFELLAILVVVRLLSLLKLHRRYRGLESLAGRKHRSDPSRCTG